MSIEDDILFFDVETTTFQTGNPFSRCNTLQCVGTLFNGDLRYHSIHHNGDPYVHELDILRDLFSRASLVVAFNAKFDLHWIKRYIPDVSFPAVYDPQLVEFIFSNQQYAYPSLAEVAITYGCDPKLDVVRINYWDKGLDTNEVPEEILKDYVLGDTQSTAQIYYKQIAVIPETQQSLINLCNEDLLTLQEAEFHGLLYNHQECERLLQESENEMATHEQGLEQYKPDPRFSFGSPRHLSALLYGGSINVEGVETVQKRRKDGTIREYQRACIDILTFPRLVKPIEDTEGSTTIKLSSDSLEATNNQRRRDGKPLLHRYFSVGDDVLRLLPASGRAREIISRLDRYSELKKLISTYYKGIPALCTEMDWPDGMIHGQFNQVVAVTGRLSSKKPNLQNFASAIKPLFYSRFD